MITLTPRQQTLAGAALFAIGLGAAALRLPAADAPAFTPPPAQSTSPAPAGAAAPLGDAQAELLPNPLPGTTLTVGPASLAVLPDGRLAAAWLAGPADQPSAASIWLSIRGRDGWSKPLPAANRESTAAGTFAHHHHLGRPQLLAEGSWLHLWYDSLPFADALGGIIVHSVSTDGGKTWSKAAWLRSAPLAALGSGLGGPPVALADGGIALPVAQGFPAARGEWLRLSATGRIVDKRRLGAGEVPAAARLDADQASVVLSGPDSDDPARLAASADGGASWQAVDATLPALRGPAALLRLADGRLLLAGNGADEAGALHLWLSPDAGRSWRLARTVEQAADGAADFAWPALQLGRDGRIHLAYTWRRQGIRHWTLTPDSLAADSPGARP